MNAILNTSSISLDTILKSKEIYNTAFNLSYSPQAIVSLDRRIMRANHAFTKVTGYTEIDLMSLTLQDILIPNPEDDGGFTGPDLEIGAGSKIEADYIRKNGSIRRGRFLFHLMKDRDTGPVCWILIMEDLTASLAADEAIRDYNQLFNHFISSNNDSILFLDTEGKILFMNKTACRQMGVAGLNEALNRNFEDYFNGLEKAAVNMAVRLAAKGMSGNFQGSLAGQKEPAWWDVDITPVAGESKNVERLMVISRDITAQKKAEQALDDMQKSLQELDRRWAKELDEAEERHAAEKQKLVQAAEKAAASLHEKDILLREIHHRVKNNMQTLSCLINLQSTQINDSAIAGMLQNCRERICSMSKVHEKLSLSENHAHIDFREYITDLVAELMHSRGTGGQVSIFSDVEEIYLDINEAVPCGLLITEILSNALKYAFPDGRKGEIRIEFRKSRRGIYTLIIRDNGIGLPGSVNLNNATTLGLELINELSKQIKGSVSVDSDGGTSYTIRFKGAGAGEAAASGAA